MLPPGHIAAGYLVGYALLKLTKPPFDQSQLQMLLWLGMFFAFAPDLDMFFSFKKLGSFTLNKRKLDPNHREYISHAPLLWLAVGLGIYFLASSLFIKYIGLLVWLGSWSHFVLDSLQYGVMWLWPFSSKRYALKDRDLDTTVHGQGFFGYWFNFLKFYTDKVKLTFYSEIVIIVFAFIIFLLAQSTALKLF